MDEFHKRVEEVFKIFKDKSILRANSYYFNYRYALEFVEFCNSNLIAISGFETFIIVEDKYLKPMTDYNADFSQGLTAKDWKKVCEDRCKWSREIISELKEFEGYVFEFTITFKDQYF